MTGVAAGVRDETGAYPAGTINFLVERRLIELSEALKRNMPMLADGMHAPLHPEAIGNDVGRNDDPEPEEDEG
jgi:hypothetical protein